MKQINVWPMVITLVVMVLIIIWIFRGLAH
jgi:hypothetical protein